jgi:predicted nucleotidyltransferase
MKPHIEIPQEKLAAFCRRNRIRKLSFFGSVLREDFGLQSDVDVLVEFEPDAIIGFFGLYDVEQELSRILGGRKVDLHTPGGLSRYIRDRVLAEAEVQYAAA